MTCDIWSFVVAPLVTGGRCQATSSSARGMDIMGQ